MSVNGIGAAGCPVTGYQTRKAERSAESSAVGFVETMAEKAAQDKTTDYDEKVFEMVGSSAPQSAIQATQKALYDFDNPLEPSKVRGLEEQQARIKERQFYVTFLEKLGRL